MHCTRLSWALAFGLVLVLSSPATGWAEEDPMDDILDGFGDSDDFDAKVDAKVDVGDLEHSEALEERIWSLQGDLNFGLSASLYAHDSPSGTDYSGLQRFRTKLALQFDLDLPQDWKLRTSGYGFYDLAYAMNGRGDYSDDVLDTHEVDFELSDTYLEGSLHERVDLRVGRQVVNWGRSESLRVLDIINPLDNREPGLVDIEDIRRSLGMAKLGIFYGSWTLTLLAIPELRYDILPADGSDQGLDLAELIPSDLELLELGASLSPAKRDIFDDLAAFMAQADDLTEIDEHVASDFGKASEFAMNLTGVFSGWDVSLQAAVYNDDTAHFDVGDGRFEHSRLWMVGSGANYTVGSWLFKAELAYIDGFEYLWTEDEKSRVDSMLGVEYYGLSDVNIVFEVAQRHINGFEDSMKLFLDFAQKDTLESALRVTVDLLNDQIHLTLLGFAIGEKAQDGSFVRLSGEYDVIDALSVEVGFLLFQRGDNPFFASIGKSDRFFAGVKYSF